MIHSNKFTTAITNAAHGTNNGFIGRLLPRCRGLSKLHRHQIHFSTATISQQQMKKKKLDFTKPPIDYVVVGAGSAGCVVTSRLVEHGCTVHLIEAGQSDRIQDSPLNLLLHMPTALAMPMHFEKYNWKYIAEPEPNLNGRIIHCPRGKGLGGSSSINGMVYVRGHKLDFDYWESKYGANGWNYENVLPYFKRAENWGGYNSDDDTVETDYRGKHGPLHVKFGNNACNTPLFDAFVNAGIDAGYGYTSDYNASKQEGFGSKAMTVYHSGSNQGKRCSTASSYLHPTLARYPNLLNVETNAYIQRIIWDFELSVGNNDQNKTIEKTSPPRAVGIEYKDISGVLQRVPVNKEVIICAGAIESPHILQVSGIGDPNHLQRVFNNSGDSAERNVVVANRNVGLNLQDHLELYFQQEVSKPVSMTPIVQSYLRKLLVGIEWIFWNRNTGLGSTNHFESAAFVRSSSKQPYPDVQFHFLPVAVSYDGQSITPSNSGHSMQVST